MWISLYQFMGELIYVSYIRAIQLKLRIRLFLLDLRSHCLNCTVTVQQTFVALHDLPFLKKN